MSKYADIIARLEKATGPDRMMDVHTYVACGLGTVDVEAGDHVGLRRADGGRSLHVFSIDGRGPYPPREPEDLGGMIGWDAFTVPPFTASLDAAIALVERMLPKAFLLMSRTATGWYVNLDGIIGGDTRPHGKAESMMLPIALLLAMFRALEAEAKP